MTTQRSLFAALFVCALAAGCGSDTGPVTSQTSKYEVGEDSPSGSLSESPEAKPGGSFDLGAPRGRTDVAGGRETPPERPRPLGSPAGASGTPQATTPGKMPTNPEEATPQQLVGIIRRLEAQEPRPGPPAQQREEFKDIQKQIIFAAETLLQKEQATDNELETAIGAKRQSMMYLGQLGEPGIRKRLFDFAALLSNDSRPVVAAMGQRIHFSTLLDAFRRGEVEDPEELVSAFRELKEIKEADPSVIEFVPEVATPLIQLGHRKEAIELISFTADVFSESEDRDVIAAAMALREQVALLDSDLETHLQAAFEGDSEGLAKLSKSLESLITSEDAGRTTFSNLAGLAANVAAQDTEVATVIYAALEAGFGSHADQEIVDSLKKALEDFQERIAIIGEPFEFEGVLADGKPFNWESYRGKVVLVDFWATWCGPCIQEIPNIKRNYAHYKEHGFEVVGVNIDQDRSAYLDFIKLQPLPWPSVLSPDPNKPHPMALKYDVVTIPFLVLVGADGNVVAINTRGKRLSRELAKLFPDAPPLPADEEEEPGESEAPAGDTPEASEEAAEASEEAKPAETTKDAPGESDDPKTSDDPPPEPSEDAKPADADAPATDDPAKASEDETSEVQPEAAQTFFVGLTVENADEEKAEADEDALDLKDVNPYSPSKRLSRSELVDFIFNMEEKPKSIQRRDGFAEAIVEAADRILAAKKTDKADEIALLAKLRALHKRGSEGDEKADSALQEVLKPIADDARANVAREVAFYQIEASALTSEELSQDELRDLLKRVGEFVKDARLGQRHLRLASSTVGAINRLEDAEEREKYFKEFGAVFSKSRDKELASYGRRVAGTNARRITDLVGKPLELAGTTALGTAFDWESYRGRVVVVDFWATWCGPCLREMPHVKKLLEENQDRGLDVVAVSIDRDLEALAAFLEKQKVAWTNLIGEDSRALAKQLGIAAIPTMLVVDRDGKVVAVGHHVDELRDEIENQLAS